MILRGWFGWAGGMLDLQRACRPAGSSHERGLEALCAAVRRGPPTWERPRPQDGLNKAYHSPPSAIRMAELGVFCGSGTVIFRRELPISQHIIVEDWTAPHYSAEHVAWAERNFFESVPASEVVLHRMPRSEALRIVPDASLDFIYIEKASRSDIEAWLPKLTAQGAMGGHDYSARQGIGFRWSVCPDVHSVFYAPDEVFEDTSWLVWPHSVKGRCRTGSKKWCSPA